MDAIVAITIKHFDFDQLEILCNLIEYSVFLLRLTVVGNKKQVYSHNQQSSLNSKLLTIKDLAA